ncbi:ATP-binding cassette sub-family G member 1 [Eumeta japonica]|uniref:ATP-binding cassette sub-family G member 1 n=1 Tax=Eumeta variegata TaxID=151549 RepID=A0A4C1UZK3_EUMVA|nr:ATP-binding cassette sub-family G member 1 [Eumeta japonica]
MHMQGPAGVATACAWRTGPELGSHFYFSLNISTSHRAKTRRPAFSASEHSKLILRGLNGEFRSGQLTAILGPSGAGKSTLLNLLAGYRVSGATGNIFVNGEPRNLRQFRKMSRYIMQEDLLQPLLTVREAMNIAADLKLGSDLPHDKKRVVVEEIIQLLRLSGARDTTSERLSGGERKRLSIALELLNNPPVIFLDEPTTGLDDVSSSTCVSLLKRVARGGRTVVCSVHTPSARLFTQFDHVYVVAAGGCAYQGSSAGLLPFLQELDLPCPRTYNPADFVIEVSSGEYGPHLDRMVAAIDNGRCQRWRDVPGVGTAAADLEIEQLNADETKTDDAPSKHTYKYRSSGVQQFCIILRRMMLQGARNKGYMWLRISMNLFLVGIISLLFWKMGNDASKTIFNLGYCYACIIAMLYVPMMPVLLAFPTEVQLLRREYFNRWYGLKPYYAALVVSRIPSTVIFSLVFLILTYIFTDQPLELHRMAMFCSASVLVAMISESLGTVISSMLNVVSEDILALLTVMDLLVYRQNSMFTGPALCVPLMLLAVYGVGSGDDPLPLVWRVARACTFTRYGIEGLVAAVYGPPRADLVCPDQYDFCVFFNSCPICSYFVKLIGISRDSYWLDVGALVLMLVATNLAGYYMLRQRLSPNYAFRAIRVIGRFVKARISVATH